MKFKNTSRYPTEEVKSLCKFALAFLKDRYQMPKIRETRVTNCTRRFRGSAWHSDIVIRIGKPENFPYTHQYPGLKTAEVITFNDWREAVVGLAAHEYFHCWQLSHRRMTSEIQCEQVAQQCLAAWRTRPKLSPPEEVIVVSGNLTDVSKKPTPSLIERRFQKLVIDRSRWLRKLKLAKTKLAKIERKIAYYQKKTEKTLPKVS